MYIRPLSISILSQAGPLFFPCLSSSILPSFPFAFYSPSPSLSLLPLPLSLPILTVVCKLPEQSVVTLFPPPPSISKHLPDDWLERMYHSCQHRQPSVPDSRDHPEQHPHLMNHMVCCVCVCVCVCYNYPSCCVCVCVCAFLRLSLLSLFPFLSPMLVCYTHIFHVHVHVQCIYMYMYVYIMSLFTYTAGV